jgi:hypothetical protein
VAPSRPDPASTNAAHLVLTVGDGERLRRWSAASSVTVVDLLTLPSREAPVEADRSGTVTVLAESAKALRAAAPLLALVQGAARSYVVAAAGRAAPELLQLPRHHVRGAAVVRAETRTLGKDASLRREVTVLLTSPVKVRDLVAVVLGAGVAPGGPPLGGLRVGVAGTDDGLLPWACGDPGAVHLGAAPEDEAAVPSPDVDVVVTDGPLPLRVPAAVRVRGRAARPSWDHLLGLGRAQLEAWLAGLDGASLLPPVDIRVLNPTGFRVDADGGVGEVVRTGPGRTVITRGDRGPVRVDERVGLDERVVAAVRGLRLVTDAPAAHRGPVEHAAFLVDAAAAGLPVVTTEPPDRSTQALIGPQLAAVLRSTTAAGELEDPLERELYCTALTRTALQQHGPRARWSGLTPRRGLLAPPRVSVVVATKRPHQLPAIRRQLTGQDWPDVEVVLGLHGFGRDHPEVVRFEQAFTGDLAVVPVGAERVFGEVLDVLSARATGHYLAKMDDDDFYGVHHLTDLVHAAEHSGADLVGCGAEYVYLEEVDVTVRRQRAQGYRFVGQVPGAALMLAAETLRSVGGWRPVAHGLDTALARSVVSAGGSVYRTHGVGFVVFRGAQGHTWDPGVDYFLKGHEQHAGFAPPRGVLGAPPARTGTPAHADS